MMWKGYEIEVTKRAKTTHFFLQCIVIHMSEVAGKVPNK